MFSTESFPSNYIIFKIFNSLQKTVILCISFHYCEKRTSGFAARLRFYIKAMFWWKWTGCGICWCKATERKKWKRVLSAFSFLPWSTFSLDKMTREAQQGFYPVTLLSFFQLKKCYHNLKQCYHCRVFYLTHLFIIAQNHTHFFPNSRHKKCSCRNSCRY